MYVCIAYCCSRTLFEQLLQEDLYVVDAVVQMQEVQHSSPASILSIPLSAFY